MMHRRWSQWLAQAFDRAAARSGRGTGCPMRRTEEGMTTAEYAVGTMAAVGFAVVLLAVVRSDAVSSALTGLITTALSAAS